MPGLKLPGHEARALLETAFFDGLLYLAPENFARRCAAGPETPLPPHPMLRTSAASEPAHPVTFLTPGGATVQAWFHRDDGRLLGLDAPFPFPVRSVRCDDWRDLDPLRLPGTRREGAPGQPTFTLTITHLRAGTSLSDALFAGSPAEPVPELLAAFARLRQRLPPEAARDLLLAEAWSAGPLAIPAGPGARRVRAVPGAVRRGRGADAIRSRCGSHRRRPARACCWARAAEADHRRRRPPPACRHRPAISRARRRMPMHCVPLYFACSATTPAGSTVNSASA